VLADVIGGILWFGMFATPLISFLIVRRFKSLNTVEKIIIGALIAIFLTVIFYNISLDIIFRDGMGPG
jgi:hypothetical protein